MTMEELYRAYFPIVYGYLLALSGDRATAEDLTSETFLRAMQRPDSFDGHCKPSTWLCAIGRNLYFNEYKRRKRQTCLEEMELVSLQDLEGQLLDREQARQIFALARALDEPQRQVFFMRAAGLSFREIADGLGGTETWARVTFFRTKVKILKELEG